jgi:hypothetical protein
MKNDTAWAKIFQVFAIWVWELFFLDFTALNFNQKGGTDKTLMRVCCDELMSNELLWEDAP